MRGEGNQRRRKEYVRLESREESCLEGGQRLRKGREGTPGQPWDRQGKGPYTDIYV